jgi:hypothetical protein
MSDWERQLDKKLKCLPPLKAPPSILVAVMQRAQARTRWAWWTWSAPARTSSLLALTAGAGSLAFAGNRLLSWLSASSYAVPARVVSALASAHNGVGAALGRALWEVLAAVGVPLAITVALTYLFCAAGAVIVWQLSLRPRGLRHI